MKKKYPLLKRIYLDSILLKDLVVQFEELISIYGEESQIIIDSGQAEQTFIRYFKEETDEEEKIRLRKEDERISIEEKQEFELFLKLKEKYEPKIRSEYLYDDHDGLIEGEHNELL